MHLLTIVALVGFAGSQGEVSRLEAELVFPLDPRHNHAPGIVECPNGDLLASWYRGSGERGADDVAVLGARRKKGDASWSEPFPMADHPGFPDCNTCMMVDGKGRLWLFWPLIIANTWESCLTNYRVSSDYAGPGAPKWEREGIIFLKPADFRDEALKRLRERLGDKLYQRLGWQPRCKPLVLPSGRILLPLYSDTYSAGLMAISDDGGKTWTASQPLAGFGSIQPSVLEKADGTLVAYMRENGVFKKVRVAESKDRGETWGTVGVTELPNPGSGLDAVKLANGHFLLLYNDTVRGRNSLAVSVSDDEGKTWKWTRHLEKQAGGAYHYPAIIEIEKVSEYSGRRMRPEGRTDGLHRGCQPSRW